MATTEKASNPEKVDRGAKGHGSIARRPDGTWRGYVWTNGKRKYFSGKTKALATQKRRELLNARDAGTLNAGQSPKLGEWLHHWLDIADHKESTRRGYRQVIDATIIPALGNVRLDQLTIEALEQLYKSQADRGLKGSTIRQSHAILRVALKQAVWRGHVTRNVAALVEPPKVLRAVTKTLSHADTDAILDAAVGTRYELRWHLALVLGLRPGEATGIEWPNVDLDRGQLHIVQQLQSVQRVGTILVTPKTHKGVRTIELPAYMVEMFREVRARQLREMAELGDEWVPFEFDGVPRAMVFTQVNGQPLRTGHDITQWQRVTDAAGLPRTSRYTARHTAASHMIAGGVDVPVVSQMLGHATSSFTMDVYVHPVDERKRAAADRFDELHSRRNRVKSGG